MSDRSIYKLFNVSKVYGDKKVLDIDYLEITKGEVMGVVGPSGAGKSTLLRLLNFIEPPTTGVIEFQGISFRTDQEIPLDLRREVTTVFQRPMLLNRSVWENISYGLKLRGIRNTRQRILEITETVGLTDLSNQRARTLSGGEAQRVSLARAMVLEPQVLLLDEPTANLDPYNVNLIEEIIRELNRKEETTMIFVTHNVFQARRIADRVTLMLNGSVIEVADVEPFFEAPRDPRTRSFTNGEMVY